FTKVAGWLVQAGGSSKPVECERDRKRPDVITAGSATRLSFTKVACVCGRSEAHGKEWSSPRPSYAGTVVDADAATGTTMRSCDATKEHWARRSAARIQP